MIKLKRIYEPLGDDDGYRILIDRLWPRGISKANAHINLWMKDVAPSADLRKWYGHDPAKWNEFEKRYEKELEVKKNLLREIKNLEEAHGAVTLLFAARDAVHCNAAVLRDALASPA